MLLPNLKSIVLYICIVLLAVLGLATWHYRALAKTTGLALQVQNAAVVATNTAAARLLKQRTEERDAKQAELNKRAAAQEKTDEKAVTQINADDQRQRSAPVVVRVRDCARDAGRSGGGAASEAARPASAGAEDAGAASGVLSEAGARRLADALTEIEKTSAAYNSCRADSYITRGQSPPSE
ncbi:hypothetical protein ABL840_09270 [Variovorax sp. NFACC27]|uniref:hypothetical protein n=1 Tax=unclassified Variovorax TaxID=663243 RepID=UPI000899A134|nr:hypothetical protein SAMN03159371_05245 [Variovorax sp. NFACC28]SEG89755.1 hypothetical protein SAMN03159365_05202 [Variovorax sp. NFACC29]SFD39735.1 hypothetical protein SAMN03159379_05135 [Variovorax sp. NFACC26]SFG42127.1 hypothetical protein SAMN03159447_03245 [Variovorax sp. NFACC27]